jgi:proteic killer suppression protein
LGRRKLDILEAAKHLMDLKSPPGNPLEKLAGDLKGKFSIRINMQFRIVFRFSNGNAHDVQIVDYQLGASDVAKKPSVDIPG